MIDTLPVAMLLLNVLRSVGRLFSSPRGGILFYHRIANPTEYGPDKFAVPLEEFKNQIANIQKRFNIVTLNDFVRSDSDDELQISLTFDDAYEDFKTKALPVLEENQIPATVFVSSKLIDSETNPVEYELYELIENGNQIFWNEKNESRSESISTREEKREVYEELKENIKFSHPDRRKELMQNVKIKPEKESNRERLLMEWDELKELADHDLVTLGDHGLYHVPMQLFTDDQIRQDLVENRNRLMSKTNSEPEYFAYPYGDFDKNTKRIVEEVGYEAAYSTEPRAYYGRSLEDHYAIPRLDASSKDQFNYLMNLFE